MKKYLHIEMSVVVDVDDDMDASDIMDNLDVNVTPIEDTDHDIEVEGSEIDNFYLTEG